MRFAELGENGVDGIIIQFFLVQQFLDETLDDVTFHAPHHGTDEAFRRRRRKRRAGLQQLLAKLSEVLFVDTLRRYVASLPEQQTGWLTGARATP